MPEISVYTQIAISFRKYDMARKCINVNMDNEGITAEDRETLNKMLSGLTTAMHKEQAVEMLSTPDANMQEIMYKTGLSEIEILEMKRRLFGTTTGEPRKRVKDRFDD